MEIRFSDPADTGYVFGALSLLDLGKLKLNPVFDEEVFSGGIFIKGHIILVVIVYHLVRLVHHKAVHPFYYELRKLHLTQWMRETLYYFKNAFKDIFMDFG